MIGFLLYKLPGFSLFYNIRTMLQEEFFIMDLFVCDAFRNNECPVCRTHCASRRSLRDDLNFDALIAALYPNVDSYEEEVCSMQWCSRKLKAPFYSLSYSIDSFLRNCFGSIY